MRSDFETLENNLRIQIEDYQSKIKEQSTKIEELTLNITSTEENYM